LRKPGGDRLKSPAPRLGGRVTNRASMIPELSRSSFSIRSSPQITGGQERMELNGQEKSFAALARLCFQHPEAFADVGFFFGWKIRDVVLSENVTKNGLDVSKSV
jgi:hypothetical protein